MAEPKLTRWSCSRRHTCAADQPAQVVRLTARAITAAQLGLTILAIGGEIAAVAGAVEGEAKRGPNLSCIGLCSSIEGGRDELGN